MRSRTTEPASIGILFLLSGCAGPVESFSIEAADPSRLEVDRELNLALIGRGFGLDGIRFDLTEGRGEAAEGALEVVLLGPGSFTAAVPPSNVSVASPRRLELRIRLPDVPPIGTYTVRLLQRGVPVAEATDLFELVAPGSDRDGGVDGGPDERDMGTNSDGGVDGGVSLDGFRYRRSVDVRFPEEAPAGITLRVPVPHGELVREGRSRPSGGDLVVARGPVPQPFQWQDARALGTDALVMVVGLTASVAAGPVDDLSLYFGSATATVSPSDAVFAFSERFSEALQPIAPGDASAWAVDAGWRACGLDQSVDRVLPSEAPPGAMCATDSDPAALTRDTLATPVLSALGPSALGRVYEMRLWLAGRTIDGAADILYFGLGSDNAAVATTELFPLNAWSGLLPSNPLSFMDVGGARTVEGWRFRPDQIEWWQEAVLRFAIGSSSGRSLHLRRVGTAAGAQPDSFFAVDNWSIRQALEPEPEITLGPVETL